jgi:riboflavin kinase / FMN adenylyltransferase
VGEPLGMTADEVGLFQLEGRVASSSSIREALASGDLAWPRTALGRRYVVDGEVVAGAGRGKGLGYPTANLRTWPRLLLPGQGIYAGVAELQDGGRHLAAIDVGTNPTFGTEPLHVEAFLLDFPDDELRGDTLTVEFWERLRDEVKFDSVDELIAAIADDVDRTRSIVTSQG